MKMNNTLSSLSYLRTCIILVVLIAPMFSCVYDKEFQYLNDQVIALNRRVNQVQEAQESVDKTLSRDLDNKLDTIRSTQAGMRVEMDQIRGNLQEMSGRIEDNEGVLRRTVERDLGDQDTIRTELAQLSQRLAVVEQYLKLEPSAVQEVPKKTIPPQFPVPPRKEAATPPPEQDETTLYDGGMAVFKAGRYEEAMDAFNSLLKKYPKSDRADNAQFWIGECYMALKQYEQAILAYQKVIKTYPKGNKVPNALLRQAIAFLEINDKTSSRLLLKKIIKQYPRSSEAKIAQQKLKTLQ